VVVVVVLASCTIVGLCVYERENGEGVVEHDHGGAPGRELCQKNAARLSRDFERS